MRVTETWNKLLTKQKNAIGSKAFKRIQKRDNRRPSSHGGRLMKTCWARMTRKQPTTPTTDVPTTCLPRVLGTTLARNLPRYLTFYILLCYGSLQLIWLCAMGNCSEFGCALQATAANLVMRYRHSADFVMRYGPLRQTN